MIEKEIHLEIHNPLLGSVEDAEAWVEQSFMVPVSYQPDEFYDNGTREHWFVDGDIIDEDGYKFDESEIDEIYNLCHDTNTGFDWDTFFSDVAEEQSDIKTERRIEAYENRMESYAY